MTAPLVEVEAGTGAFAAMLGGLLQANLEADPGKADMLRRTTGDVDIVVTDTAEEVRLRFTGVGVRVSAGPDLPADLRLLGTADVILGLSTVPLRMGLPDPLSPTGRALTGRWATGGLQIHGLPRATPLLRTLLTLLSVLA